MNEENKVGWIIVICGLLIITILMTVWTKAHISIKIMLIITSIFIDVMIIKIIRMMYVIKRKNECY